MGKYAYTADQAIELLKTNGMKLTSVEVMDVIALIQKLSYEVDCLKFDKSDLDKNVNNKPITTEQWNEACAGAGFRK